MARGKSGRVVLEIDPDLKRNIYATLESKQKTMKEWFVEEAENLIYTVRPTEKHDDNSAKTIKRSR